MTQEMLLAAEVSAGTIGFLVVLGLAAATVLLIRSMSTRLGNVRRNAEHWPSDDDESKAP